MSFSVIFYGFAKKQNSTKLPDSQGYTFDCVLKENSSINNPVLRLSLGYNLSPRYNYAYIAEYARYYYVKEWTWVQNALWECTLECDILATFRTYIGAASLYVLRSSAAYDGGIIDTAYPAKTDSTYTAVNAVSPFLSNVQSGTFVIGVSSGSAPTYGTSTFYAMDPSNLIALMQYLNQNFITESNGFSLNDAAYALQKALVNPFLYINSCIWYPLALADMPYVGSLQAVELGGITTSANGYYINASTPLKNFTLSWALPSHPQAASRGNYMNAAYRKLFLEIPPFGAVELDASICANHAYVTADITVDATNGNACLRLGVGQTSGTISVLLEKYEARVGVPMQLSALYRDMFNGVVSGASALFGTVTNLLSGNIGGAIGTAGAGIGNAVNTMKPHLQSIGGQGSFASFAGAPVLYAQFITLPDEDNSHLGRPLCANRTISTIPGYIQVMDGDIDIPGMADDAAYIKEQLEAGFFYE